MTLVQSFRCPTIWLALVVAILMTSSASAAIVMGQDGQPLIGPDGNPMRQTPFENSCGSAIAQYCPELVDPSGQTRNQVICLRPYRSSVPYFCRKAIDAARK